MVGARERVSPSNIYIYMCVSMAREVRLYGLIYTRIRQSRVYYVYIRRAKRKKRRQRELSVETEATVIHHRLSHRGSYLSLSNSLSSFSSSPYPFSVRPSCERSRTPRVACPVIPLKRIISLFETLAIL